MHHNVTITKEYRKVIEEYWTMSATKKDAKEIEQELFDEILDEKELDHEPKLQEIAQFLVETQADFVSVDHNYRIEPDLPFC